MIYFIQAEEGGPVKIGKTITLSPRFYDFSRQLKRPLCVLGVRRGGRPEEMALHDRFAHLRVKGEWFLYDRELERYIRSHTKPWDGSEPDLGLSDVARNPATTKFKIGHRFGRWTVAGAFSVKMTSSGQFGVFYPCHCDCGGMGDVPAHVLVKGHSRSCGCIKRERISALTKSHGHSKTRLYSLWKHILGRCYNPKNGSYDLHGAIGIKVCDEWLNDFQAFWDWAHANGYQDTYTVERIDLNGDYCPQNCQVTRRFDKARRAAHRRPVMAFGESKSAAGWSRDPRCVISMRSLMDRIKAGWQPERAITTPPVHSNQHIAASPRPAT